MGRSRKEIPEKYVGRQIKFPPALWSAIVQQVPDRERSAFIRQAVEEALLRRAAEAAVGYYTTDSEAVEWSEFVGDDPGE